MFLDLVSTLRFFIEVSKSKQQKIPPDHLNVGNDLNKKICSKAIQTYVCNSSEISSNKTRTNSPKNCLSPTKKNSDKSQDSLSNIITKKNTLEYKLEILSFQESEVDYLLNIPSLIDYISTNLYEMIIHNNKNKHKYNLNNLFYRKFFELFDTNYISNQHDDEDIHEEQYKKQLIAKISKYISFIVRKLESEISTIIITMIYLKRIIIQQNLFLSFNTILYVFYMLLILAHKYNEDDLFTSTAMAKKINVKVTDFHKMEVLLCCMIDHKLYVGEQEYEFNHKFIITKLKQMDEPLILKAKQ